MKVNVLQNDEEIRFIACDEEGKEIECQVLFTVEDAQTNRTYIVYTDDSRDENDCICVYANQFDPDSDEKRLLPIEDECVWRVIEQTLTELQKECTEEENPY